MYSYWLYQCLSLPFAQNQRTGNLTIFSEDGDKFYLVLNGEKQNDIPQSNIRIEELPQPYYSARIILPTSLFRHYLKQPDDHGCRRYIHGCYL